MDWASLRQGLLCGGGAGTLVNRHATVWQRSVRCFLDRGRARDSGQRVVGTLPGNRQSARASRGQNACCVSATCSSRAQSRDHCDVSASDGRTQSALEPCSSGAHMLLHVTRVVRSGCADLARRVLVYCYRRAPPFQFHGYPGAPLRHGGCRRPCLWVHNDGAGDAPGYPECCRRSGNGTRHRNTNALTRERHRPLHEWRIHAWHAARSVLLTTGWAFSSGSPNGSPIRTFPRDSDAVFQGFLPSIKKESTFLFKGGLRCTPPPIEVCVFSKA